jgi:chromosome segregation ATPase
MSDQLIARADLRLIECRLSTINENLDVVNNNVNVVSNQIAAVEQQLEATKSDLAQLTEEFRRFVRQDAMMKNVQLAETRLVKIRQELEQKYGHYEDVRRRAVGILQAVDSSLVRKETIRIATEEQLLAAPRYWLAPCLIALSAWLNDNRELAERAVMEALNRDDEKTSLFFALVARRGGRFHSSRAWLERYLGQPAS